MLLANQKGYFVRKLLIGVIFLTSLPVILFLLAWLYPRPLDTTLPSVFDGDGTEIDYCKPVSYTHLTLPTIYSV